MNVVHTINVSHHNPCKMIPMITKYTIYLALVFCILATGGCTNNSNRPVPQPRSQAEADNPTAIPAAVPTLIPTASEVISPVESPTAVPTTNPTAVLTDVPPTPLPTNTPVTTHSATTPLTPGRNEIFIEQMIDGKLVSRTVFIQMPKTPVSGQSYPIVFAFHGAGGRGNIFLRNRHLTNLIDAGEFVGVYPNGHATDETIQGGFWHVGSEPTNADDIAFVDLIVQTLATYSELDTSRIYGMGVSNGAGMVNLLGKSTTHFKAIAPLFSQQTENTGSLIALQSLSVFQLSGEKDTLIPLNGGTSPVGQFMSAQESALNWAQQFNCATPPLEETLSWGNASLLSFTFSNCDGGDEIKYFVAQEITHKGFADEQARELLHASIWAFFKQH